MSDGVEVEKFFFRRIALMVLLFSAAYAPIGLGQERSEIDELKGLLVETQESMQQMMEKHQKQMDVLQRRIQELEQKSIETEASQENFEDALMERDLDDADRGDLLDSNLSLHGYYDFLFLDATDSKSRSFILNELSLFLRGSTDDERWTFFSELEFELFDGDDFFFKDNSSDSELEIETAWLEYSVSDTLQVRAGKHLLPQYWQTYHYPNLTLSTRPPAMVGRIFPSDIIGLEARGDYWFDNQRGVSYVAYLGNGGDSEESEVDQNENKAVGGRVTAHLAGVESPFDTLDLSVSGYTGQDNDGNNETILGLDAQIRIQEWEFLTEFALGDQHVQLLDGQGNDISGPSDTLGYYFQLGYNFMPRWHTFYRYDELDLYDDGPSALDAHQNTIGINYRPRSNISLKLELFEADVDRLNDPFHGVAAAIVYNF